MHFVSAKGILTARKGVCGMNIYRGCTHGCVYCDSRSRCYRMEHAFEDVEVKQNAPELLERALRSRRKPCMIGTGAMSDPYVHCERELGLTRRCLELIRDYGFGAALLTKSDLVLRDIDLFLQIQSRAKCVVQMTMTVWDEELSSVLEPGVCSTRRRAAVLEELQRQGIPTVVWLTPLLPFLTDTEENVLAILTACAAAGVRGIVAFDMGLTLREGDREYYYAALDRHFPGLKARYIRTYGDAYRLSSPNAGRLTELFQSFCREHGMLYRPEDCFAWMNAFPNAAPEQLSLFS